MTLPWCWEKFQELISGRCSTYQIEKRYLRRDGRLIWGALTVSVSPDASGGPRFAIGIIEDITERKKAEEALQASREHLEASVRASDTGLWDWNLKTNEVYYSPEWKSQLGYADHEVSNQLDEWQSRLHPDDRHRAVSTVLAFLQNPWPNYEVEFRLRHKDGSYRWILTRASVLRSPNGQPYRMLGSHLDITERKKAEERLREYEKVVEGLQEMIAVVNREYRYLIANRAFLSYREMSAEQVVGRLVWDIIDKDIFETIIKPRVDECFQNKVVQYEMSYPYPRLGERQLRITYLPIEGPLGVDRVAVVLEDITLRKRAERDLREAHQQLTTELQERTRAEQRVRALSDRLLSAQEEERRKIARELHDDLSQEIAALSISVSNLKRSIPEQDRELHTQADAIHQRIARLRGGYSPSGAPVASRGVGVLRRSGGAAVVWGRVWRGKWDCDPGGDIGGLRGCAGARRVVSLPGRAGSAAECGQALEGHGRNGADRAHRRFYPTGDSGRGTRLSGYAVERRPRVGTGQHERARAAGERHAEHPERVGRGDYRDGRDSLLEPLRYHP